MQKEPPYSIFPATRPPAGPNRANLQDKEWALPSPEHTCDFPEFPRRPPEIEPRTPPMLCSAHSMSLVQSRDGEAPRTLTHRATLRPHRQSRLVGLPSMDAYGGAAPQARAPAVPRGAEGCGVGAPDRPREAAPPDAVAVPRPKAWLRAPAPAPPAHHFVVPGLSLTMCRSGAPRVSLSCRPHAAQVPQMCRGRSARSFPTSVG